jgi:hypothetical protein
MVFFAFPEDARWNDDRDAVEFTVLLGEHEGTVCVGRRVFQRLLAKSPYTAAPARSRQYVGRQRS